jgi:hypothetical protein
LWWTGYRGYKRGKGQDLEKTHHGVHRHGSGSVRSGSHSRTSSRSTTPTLELEDGPVGGHVRRGSNASDRRRKKPVAGTRVQKLTPAGSRSATPEVPSPLVRENSFTSVSSRDSVEGAQTPMKGHDESSKSMRASAKPSSSPARKAGSGRATKQT